MSLTQDHGDHVFQCDAARCRETLHTATSNFDSARNLVRRAGWRPKRMRDGEWGHLCRGCVNRGAWL